MAAKHVLVVDNGGCTLKAGFSNQDDARAMPNAVMKAKSERRRAFIGDQIEECRDVSGLFYILPYQKGYLINWETQKDIWDYVFGKDCLNVQFPSTTAIITQPYFNFHSVQEGMYELFFEEYDLDSMVGANPGSLSAFKYGKENPNELCCLVVDCGYSFTHIIPYVQGKKITEFVCRIDIGGKLLTNHLKDIISYRQLHVMDETYVINQVKEDTCFVSLNFNEDMAVAQSRGDANTIVCDYVLPDFSTIRRGYVRSKNEPNNGEQIVRMNNERFAVPELLFHPSDIGIQQMGVSEAVIHVVQNFPAEVQQHLYNNIVLIGGTAQLPNFRERVLQDVRAMAPAEFDVRVTLPKNPQLDPWQSGCLFANDSSFSSYIVTKKDYEEHGLNVCLEKFDI